MHYLFSRTLAFVCGAAFAASAFAQAAPPDAGPAYPTHPVTLIVPYAAGSQTDSLARVMGSELQKALGQSFIVENKPGMQGSIAAETVARSAPDGYTLLLTTNSTAGHERQPVQEAPIRPCERFCSCRAPWCHRVRDHGETRLPGQDAGRAHRPRQVTAGQNLPRVTGVAAGSFPLLCSSPWQR